jgi:predicted ATPase/transcriptional regulator with XRE-family HTH domain/Tfp pilus assembly protein PilF
MMRRNQSNHNGQTDNRLRQVAADRAENEVRVASMLDFGALLRHHRLAAGLSQQALAERAGMSSDGISALERGHRRTPQRETIALLAGALSLRGDQRRDFEVAAARSGLSRRQSADAGSLPLSLTSFVGRDDVVAEVTALVRAHRLVTLTGVGGIGKTQTALRVGAAFNDGNAVRFVALAPVDGALVVSATAFAVGVQEVPNRPLLETLLAFLKNKSFLLILDNCEHVVADAASVAGALLAGCPHLRILATSREPLKAAGEQSYRLPSLGVPPMEAVHRIGAADAATYGAIALFLDRARAADHRFALTDENAPLVVELCGRLDGIPLAIELAAARVNLISLEALTQRLDERLRILTGGERIALPRQQTMRATIEWSYELLSSAEQRLFERLSVFVGGCTLAAAEAIATGAELDAIDVVELLSSLAEKSLVVADLERREPRYRLLESTRAFAVEKLASNGEPVVLMRRHAQWAAELADHARSLGSTMSTESWVREFEPELENARAAIDWAIAAGEMTLAASIACGFTGAWYMNHGHAEPRRWLEAVLPRIDPAVDPALAARVWRTLSTVTFGTRRVEAAQRACDLDAPFNDIGRDVANLYQISTGLLQAGRVEDAEAFNDRALRLCHEHALTRSRRYAAALDTRARIAGVRERIDEARHYYAEALSLMTALGDEHEAILIRINMGELEYRSGRFDRALEFADAAVAAARRVRSRHREITALANLTAYRLARGDMEGARANGREALLLSREAPPLEITIAIQHLATVAARSGDAASAARLCGYVDAWYRNEGCQRELTEQRSYELLRAALHEKLGDGELAVFTEQGARFSEEQAVAKALAV